MKHNGYLILLCTMNIVYTESSGSFFTKIENSFLPLAQNPKILGVTFDPLFTFSPHSRELAKGAAERLKILKALAGTSWG